MKIKSPTTLSPRQSQQLKALDGQLRKAAELYEAQFLREMVKAMRGTVNPSEFTKPSQAEKIYRDQLDHEYVEKWVGRGGVGFADMIYRDLVDKFYPQLKHLQQRQKRPLQLTDRFQGMVRRPSTSAKQQTYQLQLSPGSANDLRLPWPGKLQKSLRLNNDHQLMSFAHPNGLSSTFIFPGQPRAQPKVEWLNEGEIFAELKQSARQMLWQLSAPDQQKAAPSATEEGF